MAGGGGGVKWARAKGLGKVGGWPSADGRAILAGFARSERGHLKNVKNTGGGPIPLPNPNPQAGPPPGLAREGDPLGKRKALRGEGGRALGRVVMDALSPSVARHNCP